MAGVPHLIRVDDALLQLNDCLSVSRLRVEGALLHLCDRLSLDVDGALQAENLRLRPSCEIVDRLQCRC